VTQLHARGEKVIQNIRKRAREQREKADAQAPPAAAAGTRQPPAAAAAVTRKPQAKAAPLLPKGKRLRPTQPTAAVASMVGSMTPAQLAELQVLIAQQLQAGGSE
jgi:hypothetical protein